MKQILCVFAIAAVAAAAGACSDNAFTPSVDNVAGDYSVLQLVTSADTGSTDWVAAGTTWSMTLHPNGVTTGHLFIPDGNGPGIDVDADMAGLWVLSGDTLRIDQTADTFVRDMTYLASENRLTGDRIFGTIRVRVVLGK